jgi:hypothetical protein
MWKPPIGSPMPHVIQSIHPSDANSFPSHYTISPHGTLGCVHVTYIVMSHVTLAVVTMSPFYPFDFDFDLTLSAYKFCIRTHFEVKFTCW